MAIENQDTTPYKEVSNSEKTDLQVVSFVSPKKFESWLEQNHSVSNGIWMRIYKKNSNIKTIIYDEALEVALCYGWIDGQVKKQDENSYIQKFTPRRPKSMWSKRNVEKVAHLEKQGRMKPSGWKEIELAKADGRFERAYNSPREMVVPEDFMLELTKDKKAHDFFKTLNKTNLYTIGWRLQTATSPQARLKQIIAIIEKLEKEEKFH